MGKRIFLHLYTIYIRLNGVIAVKGLVMSFPRAKLPRRGKKHAPGAAKQNIARKSAIALNLSALTA